MPFHVPFYYLLYFQDEEDEEEVKVETARREVGKAKKKTPVTKGMKLGGNRADYGRRGEGRDEGRRGGRDQGGGEGGGLAEVKGGRSIPVTLSMKTETVFTKLLGDNSSSSVAKPNNNPAGGGRSVELNLLSLQPVPINLLPSSNHNTLPPFPPSPPSSLPSPPPPPLHIGPNSNLAKQEGGECVGRQGSTYSLPPSPLDQDKMDEEEDEEDEEEMMTSMEEKMEMLSSMVPVFEEGEDEDDEEMVPSVEQLFQRSFSYELRDLWGGGGELVVLEGLLDADSKADLLVLEDIVSVIGGDPAAKVVV